ncbi:Isopenicillin N synthase [Tistlia consotensis]|uniref:2-oxoglutarate-dependent ethylene/succinate-forming enzyme n=1 Tax=Tistlia consotensis USBA 355 TaxID=560819 RepID=A0A1Y6B8L0_9PROT|nr:2-oxoglutarate and iron-dependent oxygenase domain-containing protein [Tistlia consotensis]SME90057.1 Isopenicillin N synthase [Tistlia consotensis USBA 355]SNR26519.1 Isopenicillin N synthase [Tistlia consotensis]
MSEAAVPLVDLSESREGPGRAVAAEAIRRACETIGFFAVTGHGVPQDVIAAARREALAFFARPREVKMQTPQPPERISRGYSWLGSRGLAFSLGNRTPPDLQESFAMGPVEPAPAALDGTEDARAFFAPNVWPAVQPGLQPAFEAYYRAMAELSAHVLQLFATALGLPRDHFDAEIDHHTSTMRAILYPPPPETVEEGQLRAGEHTDYGTLTIVRGDDVPGGLQVRTRAGAWIDVHPPAEGFVCNIGDLMMRWSNDHWLSNLHRVALPPAEAGNRARLTFAFFHNPNADALIEPIRGFYREGEAAKYPPARFGDLFLRKHLSAQTMKAAQGAGA